MNKTHGSTHSWRQIKMLWNSYCHCWWLTFANWDRLWPFITMRRKYQTLTLYYFLLCQSIYLFFTSLSWWCKFNCASNESFSPCPVFSAPVLTNCDQLQCAGQADRPTAQIPATWHKNFLIWVQWELELRSRHQSHSISPPYSIKFVSNTLWKNGLVLLLINLRS